MQVSRKIKDFKNDERGSLLIFFALCLTFLLGILALSFDMGRRAATQTDMQSFADNVALAAAGELDGRDDSIIRAKLAATTVIVAANERLKAGTAGSNFTITFDPETDLVFYENLPDNDNSLRANFDIATVNQAKYQLPPTDEVTSGGGGGGNGNGNGNGNGANAATFSSKARYVGVRLDTVDVDWLFANVFPAADLPSEAVGAVAIASYTAFTCDIAPLMFCMPQDPTNENAPVEMSPGEALLLRSGGNASQGNVAAWGGGDFGFLDLDKYITGGNTCDRFSDQKSRDACIINELESVAQCFAVNGVDMEPGQRVGLDAAMYNMRFGLFRSGYKGYAGNPLYAPGPHSVRGIVPSNSNKDVCTSQNVITSPDTTAFPEDDCFLDLSPSCTRWGDGVWNQSGYYDHNYGIWDPNDIDGVGGDLILGSGTGGEISDAYKTFKTAPENANYFESLGLPAVYDDIFTDADAPKNAAGNLVWPDFRVPGAVTRYQVYKGEIARSQDLTLSLINTGNANMDILVKSIFQADGTVELADGLNSTYEMYPILPNRDGDNGLPVCTPDVDAGTGTPVVAPATFTPQGADGPIEVDRRVLTIAGIDCNAHPVNGADVNVPVFKYYRAFLMKPVGDDGTNPPKFDIWMEIIEDVSEGDGGTALEAVSRVSIQLNQ